jgi:mannose/fructose/N-acetylgalactosamine-specific phosphotransferase system component IIC
LGIQPTGIAITTIRTAMAITRMGTTDRIDTMAIPLAPLTTGTGIGSTAITGIIITIATNVAWKTNSTELARMRFRASSFFANLLRSFRNSTS